MAVVDTQKEIHEIKEIVKETAKELQEYRRETDKRFADHDREIEINRGALKRAFEKAEEKQSVTKQVAPLGIVTAFFSAIMLYYIVPLNDRVVDLEKAVTEKNADIASATAKLSYIAGMLPEIDRRQRKLVEDLATIKGEVKAQGAIIQTLDREGSRAMLRELPK